MSESGDDIEFSGMSEQQDKQINIQEETLQTLDNLELNQKKDLNMNIDFQIELKKIYSDGLFRKILFKEQNDQLQPLLQSDKNSQFTQSIFWVILLHKYPNIFHNEDLKNQISQDIQDSYINIFAYIKNPKDILLNYLIFGDSYLCIMLIHNLFKNQQESYDKRFLYDCLHYVIFKTIGLYVTDSYIQQNMTKIFNQNKLFSYITTEENKQKKQISQKIQLYEFFGVPEQVVYSQQGWEFQEKISQKLRKQLNTSNITSRQQDIYKDDSFSHGTTQIYKNLKYEKPLQRDKNLQVIKEIEQQQQLLLTEDKIYYQGLRAGKRKFQTNKLGPFVANVMQSTNGLQAQSNLTHDLGRSDNHRYKFYSSLENIKKEHELLKKPKVQIVKEKKKSLYDKYNLQSTKQEEYKLQQQLNIYGKFQHFFKDVKDLEFIQRKLQEDITKLPSKIGTTENIIKTLLEQQNFKDQEKKKKSDFITLEEIQDYKDKLLTEKLAEQEILARQFNHNYNSSSSQLQPKQQSQQCNRKKSINIIDKKLNPMMSQTLTTIQAVNQFQKIEDKQRSITQTEQVLNDQNSRREIIENQSKNIQLKVINFPESVERKKSQDTSKNNLFKAPERKKSQDISADKTKKNPIQQINSGKILNNNNKKDFHNQNIDNKQNLKDFKIQQKKKIVAPRQNALFKNNQHKQQFQFIEQQQKQFIEQYKKFDFEKQPKITHAASKKGILDKEIEEWDKGLELNPAYTQTQTTLYGKTKIQNKFSVLKEYYINKFYSSFYNDQLIVGYTTYDKLIDDEPKNNSQSDEKEQQQKNLIHFQRDDVSIYDSYQFQLDKRCRSQTSQQQKNKFPTIENQKKIQY